VALAAAVTGDWNEAGQPAGNGCMRIALCVWFRT
jgi:hypothetical protein